MDENPFSRLNIDDASFLDEQTGRTRCPKCGKGRKYYCYNCYVILGDHQDRVPQIKVPVFTSIITYLANTSNM